jgi:cytochrome c556
MVVIGILTALTATGCASTPKMTADEAIEKRKALMKEQGAAWRSIQDKAKAGQIAAIAPDAEKLSTTSKQIPALFPEGSLDPARSAAKPEIWQKRAEFDAAAKNLETWSNRLAAASKANNTTETQAIMKEFGKMACGTCHTPFRVPPKQ